MTSSESDRAREQSPHEDALSTAQVGGVLMLLDRPAGPILDLGCGNGRLLIPLARAGHDMVGVDRDDVELEECRGALERCDARATLHGGDFVRDPLPPGGPYRAVLLLGNVLMTVWRVDDAVALLRRIHDVLADDGVLVVDDIAGAHWPEVAEGNWANGLDPEGQEQFAWAEREPVFVLRRGDDVSDDFTLRPDEPRYRLWDDGALMLLARLTGFSDPQVRAEDCLIVLRRRAPSSGAVRD